MPVTPSDRSASADEVEQILGQSRQAQTRPFMRTNNHNNAHGQFGRMTVPQGKDYSAVKMFYIFEPQQEQDSPPIDVQEASGQRS